MVRARRRAAEGGSDEGKEGRGVATAPWHHWLIMTIG